jgi:hypothetical protein
MYYAKCLLRNKIFHTPVDCSKVSVEINIVGSNEYKLSCGGRLKYIHRNLPVVEGDEKETRCLEL